MLHEKSTRTESTGVLILHSCKAGIGERSIRAQASQEHAVTVRIQKWYS
jgi:hypothetical protein